MGPSGPGSVLQPHWASTRSSQVPCSLPPSGLHCWSSPCPDTSPVRPNPMLSLFLQLSVQASRLGKDFPDSEWGQTSLSFRQSLWQDSDPSWCLSWWPFGLLWSDYLMHSLSHPPDHELLDGKDCVYLLMCKAQSKHCKVSCHYYIHLGCINFSFAVF